MAISLDDYLIVTQGTDGETVAQGAASAKATDDYSIAKLATDGEIVSVEVTAMKETDDEGIVALATDGEVVAVSPRMCLGDCVDQTQELTQSACPGAGFPGCTAFDLPPPLDGYYLGFIDKKTLFRTLTRWGCNGSGQQIAVYDMDETTCEWSLTSGTLDISATEPCGVVSNTVYQCTGVQVSPCTGVVDMIVLSNQVC